MIWPSPNHGERRGGATPNLVVIHYTAMASCAESRARLCDPLAEVSAHWLIDLDGRTEQLVDEARRAWHAGAGAWGGVTDVNSHSIGIELQNAGNHPFPAPQIAALETLLAAILTRWSIPPSASSPIPTWPPRANPTPARALTGGVWRTRGCQSGLHRPKPIPPPFCRPCTPLVTQRPRLKPC